MKSVTRVIVILALLVSAATLQAQNPQGLAGQWQGTINPGRELRLVFVVANAAGSGALTAVMYSIDQSPQGIPATVVVQGGTVRMAVAAGGVTVEGALSTDGNSIAGTFKQGPASLAITLARSTRETAWPLPALPKPMAADAPTTFDVATVKPSNPDTPGKLFTVRGREVVTINTTVNDLITMAYNVHVRQVSGGPSWMDSDKFDITGRPVAEGVPNTEQLRALIQSLLVDRFKLTMRTETHDLPAYVLVVGPNGHKLAANTTNPNGLPSLLFRGLGILPAINASMIDFTRVMQQAVLDRPVVDKTALQGRFDFTLNWTPDESQFRGMGVRVPPPPADGSGPPGLFTAIQEQLGLRFDRTNAPVDVLVIDRVERPSEN